jgi:hypothetical protein
VLAVRGTHDDFAQLARNIVKMIFAAEGVEYPNISTVLTRSPFFGSFLVLVLLILRLGMD